MKLIKKLICVSIFSCCSIKTAVATIKHHELNFTSTLGAPITTLTTETQEKGIWSLSQRTEYYRGSPLSDSQLLANPNAKSQVGYLLNYLTPSYGITDDLAIGAALPFVHSTNVRSSIGTEAPPFYAFNNLGGISGVADTTIFGLWHIVYADKNKFKINIALTSGTGIPTGQTNVSTNSGRIFSASFQPGSGAFSPFGGIIFSKQSNKLTLSSNLNYAQPTIGSQGTTFGKFINYNFAAVYPLLKNKTVKKVSYSISGVLELNGAYSAQDTIYGRIDPDSGGNLIYLSPGFRASIGKKISCYLGLGFPFAQALNGTQNNGTYSVFSGIDLTF